MIPLENRWLSCCWIEVRGKASLIDCGEGTQIALKKAGCRLSRLEILLITHFHADHIAGLPGLLLSLGNQGKTTPLLIVGPAGLGQVVSALTVISPVLPYPVALYEIKEGTRGTLETEDTAISYLPLDHGIPCLGYRFCAKRKPIFNPEKAAGLRVPQNLFRTLHAGHAVTLEDGRRIEPGMVLDGERAPICVCYCTDTRPIGAIAEFARGADLLVCEGMYADEAMRGKMEERGHMVFGDSARLAREAGAKRLWLTHYSPALTDPKQALEPQAKFFPRRRPLTTGSASRWEKNGYLNFYLSGKQNGLLPGEDGPCKAAT
jgi:ribonuclease Z